MLIFSKRFIVNVDIEEYPKTRVNEARIQIEEFGSPKGDVIVLSGDDAMSIIRIVKDIVENGRK